MPKRNSKQDVSQNALRVVEEATGAPLVEKKVSRSLVSQVMAEMGRKGGRKGGKTRMGQLTAEQRSQLALKAAQARWEKRKKQSKRQREQPGELQ